MISIAVTASTSIPPPAFRDRIVVRSEDQPVGIPQIDRELPAPVTRELMTADRWRRRHLTQVICVSEHLEPERDHVGHIAETTFEFLADCCRAVAAGVCETESSTALPSRESLRNR